MPYYEILKEDVWIRYSRVIEILPVYEMRSQSHCLVSLAQDCVIPKQESVWSESLDP
jgi:hypothetical protein